MARDNNRGACVVVPAIVRVIQLFFCLRLLFFGIFALLLCTNVFVERCCLLWELGRKIVSLSNVVQTSPSKRSGSSNMRKTEIQKETKERDYCPGAKKDFWGGETNKTYNQKKKKKKNWDGAVL